MVIDWSAWETYLSAALAAVAAYVVKTQVSQGQEQARLRTIIEYYIERQTKDAAVRLDIPNPAPPEIRKLLQKHIQGEDLTDEERPLLVTWLKEVAVADKTERSPALQLLTGIATTRRNEELKKRRWWPWKSGDCK